MSEIPEIGETTTLTLDLNGEERRVAVGERDARHRRRVLRAGEDF